mmetsp:Transcript_133792/g.303472  ORF Transcript_133792/g.303472 Transcript_133792/m.303472 type:complete len:277 (-) Transcript_133792:148-978(-)
MLIIDHGLLDCLQRGYHQIGDPLQQLVDPVRSLLRQEVLLQPAHVPLASVGVVGCGGLLDSHISQVHHLITHGSRVIGVPVLGKSRKTASVEMHIHRAVASDQHVKAQVELLPPDQQRVGHILLHHIRLSLGVVRLPASVGLPLGNGRQPIKKENALTLGSPDGLHDPPPSGVRRLFEFLHKNEIFHGEVVGHGKASVHLRLLNIPVFLCGLLGPLHIFHKVILACQLKMVAEVIHTLVGPQMHGVKGVVDPILLTPENVPAQLPISFLIVLPKPT